MSVRTPTDRNRGVVPESARESEGGEPVHPVPDPNHAVCAVPPVPPLHGAEGAAPAGDDARCHWCRGVRLELDSGDWYCPRGCAAAHIAPYRGLCEDCRAEYMTGNPERRRQCERCAGREHGRLVQEYDAPGQSHTGYMHRMRADGANRAAVRKLRGGR